MRQLNSLRDSTREDVSSLVKTVLHHLNQTSTLRKPYHNRQFVYLLKTNEFRYVSLSRSSII